MNKRTILIIALVLVIITAVGLTVMLLSQQQDIRSRADTPDTATQQQGVCQAPAAPSNLAITYPNDQGGQANFAEASCSWDAVPDASNYAVKITEVDTSTQVKSETVTGTTIVFPVTNGNTYKCDVSATNSCGATSSEATVSLLCQADVEVVTPTQPPVPTVPVVTNPPQPTSPVVPTVVTYTCGQVGCSATSPCIAGLECVAASNGQSYCAYPIYKTACQSSPSSTSCCTNPPAQPQPALPPSGDSTTLLLWGAGGIVLVVLGSLFFIL